MYVQEKLRVRGPDHDWIVEITIGKRRFLGRAIATSQPDLLRTLLSQAINFMLV